jgi:hypothetical protein
VKEVLAQALDEPVDGSALQTNAVIDAGIINQSVNSTEALYDFGNSLLTLSGIVEMGFNECAGLFGGLNFGHELPHVIRQPAEHDDPRALIKAGAGNAGADARAAAGDNNDLVFQS